MSVLLNNRISCQGVEEQLNRGSKLLQVSSLLTFWQAILLSAPNIEILSEVVYRIRDWYLQMFVTVIGISAEFHVGTPLVCVCVCACMCALWVT